MWTKIDFQLIGKDDAGVLTVANGDFKFACPVNPTVKGDIDAFVEKAKACFEEHEKEVVQKDFHIDIINGILAQLNK